jgi:hypothetical protein
MPPLFGSRSVGLEDLLDDRQEWLDLRLATWLCATITRRLDMRQDLLQRLPMQVILAAGRSVR